MIFASVVALAVIATLIAGLSLWGLLFPSGLVSFVRSFMRRPGSMVFAVAIRVLLALLLWVTAAQSNAPTTLRVLAALSLLAALGIAIAGFSRISRLMERVASWPRAVVRLLCLLGVALGLFLLWAVSPVWAGH